MRPTGHPYPPIVISLLFALLLLPAGSPVPAIAAGEEPINVPLNIWNGIPLVDVHVDGRGPYRFAFDLEGSGGSIDSDLARELGLCDAGDGVAVCAKVSAADLTIGSLTLPGAVLEGEDAGRFGDDADRPRGVLRLGLLSDYLATLDYPNETFVFARGTLAAGDDGVLGYVLDDQGRPTLPLWIKGKRVDTIIDPTLPGGIILNRKHVERLSLPEEPMMIGRTMNEEGTFPILSASFGGTIMLGEQALDHSSLRFIDLVDEAGIGQEVLNEFAITFDQANRRVRFVKDEGQGQRQQQLAAAVASMDEGSAALKAAFNADRDKVRMLLILSPT